MSLELSQDRAWLAVLMTPAALAMPPVDEHDTSKAYHWSPERSPTGPVSIVASGRNRRIAVLRNGIEIGASDVIIDGPVTATTAFTLRAVDAAWMHWLRLPLPGEPKAVAGEVTVAERARTHLPEAFHGNSIL